MVKLIIKIVVYKVAPLTTLQSLINTFSLVNLKLQIYILRIYNLNIQREEAIMHYEIFYSCVSHIGNVRSINQDNFICNGAYMRAGDSEIVYPLNGTVFTKTPVLFGIFDGMGGEECGEIASYIAAREASVISIKNDEVLTLTDYCEHSNTKICEYAENNSVSAMGTTAAMLLCSKNKITLCNIGDSKIFRFADGELEQISKDHIVISAFGTKPPLSQNLGIPPDQLLIEPYLSQGKYKNGDKYLICSDGLTDMLTLDEIKELLSNQHIKDTATSLVNKALKNGGKDNVTVIALEIKQKKNKLLKIFNR